MMAVAPLELECVLADEFYFAELQIIGNVYGKDDSHSRHFVLARGAWTHASQPRRNVVGFCSISPDNHQLSGADLLYLFRRRGRRAAGTLHLFDLENRRFEISDTDLR